MLKVGLRWRDIYLPKDKQSSKQQSVLYTPRSVADDPHARHAVYRDLFERLGLTEEHNRQLRERGLSQEAIETGGYKSVSGSSVVLSTALVQAYGRVAVEVPGVYEGSNGQPFFRSPAGILIPIRDSEGLIQGVQVRTGLQSMKYYSPMGSVGLVHVPLAVDLCDVAWVTEGPLKADVVAYKSGLPIVAIPGVTNWRAILPKLSRWRIGRVVTAVDMDWLVKPQVRRQLHAFEGTLLENGFRVERALWNPSKGNGIDDCLVSGGTVKLMEVRDGREGKEGEREPAGAASG